MAVVGCLPNGNRVVFIQMILYFVASFLGFFVTIPVGITLRNFHGSCILYAQIVIWGTAIIWPWSETSCDYVLYMNLAINIFYATFMGVLTLIIFKKAFRSQSRSYHLLEDWHISFILTAFNPVFIIINSLITILEVAGTAIITDGLHRFCQFTMDYVTKLPSSNNSTVPKTCSDLQKWNGWNEMRIVRGTTAGVVGYNFFGCLTLATIAQWLLMVVWFAQLILNVFMSCRVCSCEVAEEKRKPDKSLRVAQRRSRLATPIGTPGGRHTPGGFAPQMVSMPPPAPRDVYYPSDETKEPYYPSTKEPYYPSTKEPYYPPSKSPSDPNLPPSYRVTPPRQETPPPPPPPQMEEPSPPPMSDLKVKQVYRRNTLDSQI